MTKNTNDIWTIKDVLDWSVGYLSRKGDEHPRLSTEHLIANATGLSRIEVYANFDRPLVESELKVIREALTRRATGEPLQYVIGETAFRHIVVESKSNVLIPRPETEILVELVLEYVDELLEAQNKVNVLEIGTGTGCIALSLAHERLGKVFVTATDISKDAYELANKNTNILGLSEYVSIIHSSLAEDVPCKFMGNFDVLVSNPPYIPSAELKDLPKEIKDFEPKIALDGGEDGLETYRKLLEVGRNWLKPDGLFAVELHENKVNQALEEISLDYKDAKIEKDLTGRDRFLLAKRITKN